METPTKEGIFETTAGSETDILEGTKKSKTQIEGTADDAADPTEVNITATATTTTDGPGAQEGKIQRIERRTRRRQQLWRRESHPPYHHSDTNEKEQKEQELPKKQQRSKRESPRATTKLRTKITSVNNIVVGN